jgi:integrase
VAKTFLKLTRPAMRRLPVGGTIIEHGIAFERTGSGDGVFTVNVMVDGQRIHRVVGRESEGTTRTQAEEFIQKVRRDARDGRLSLPKGRKVTLGFSEAAEKYLECLGAGDGRDLRMKRARFDHHLKKFFDNTPLSRISSFDVERYKKQRLQEPAARGGVDRRPANQSSAATKQLTTTKAGTINRELAALSHLFNKAVEWGWIDRRPALIRRLKEDRGRIVYLTVEQIDRLVAAAKNDDNPQVLAFVVIGLETAMRRMEILSVRREHVDLDRLTIFVPKAKAGAREQPITRRLAEFLRAYSATLPADEQWLFPSPASATGHTTDIRKGFRRAVAAAGLNPDQIVRHTLRHTAITHLVQAGVDLPTVKRISGHKTLIMVERYAHANGEHIKEAMNKLEERYRKVA